MILIMFRGDQLLYIKIIFRAVNYGVCFDLRAFVDERVNAQMKKHPESQRQNDRFEFDVEFYKPSNRRQQHNIFPSVKKYVNLVACEKLIPFDEIFQTKLPSKREKIIYKMIQINQNSSDKSH